MGERREILLTSTPGVYSGRLLLGMYGVVVDMIDRVWAGDSVESVAHDFGTDTETLQLLVDALPSPTVVTEIQARSLIDDDELFPAMTQAVVAELELEMAQWGRGPFPADRAEDIVCSVLRAARRVGGS